MPVIGHACVGSALGVWAHASNQHRTATRVAVESWLLALMVLSYVPDIAAQALSAGGVQSARSFGHSVFFALVIAVGAAELLRRLGWGTWRRLFAIAFGAILLHDLMDLLQSGDRVPLWPVSDWNPMPPAWHVIPTGLLSEVVLFAPVAVAAGVWYERHRPALDPVGPRRRRWIILALIALLTAGAAITHLLRDLREIELRAAAWLNERQMYAAALDACDRAGRWPSTAKPGRIEYLRAEALLGLGNVRAAEQHYLASYAADPQYFWTVADLALFYASHGPDAAARRAAAAPWQKILRERFSEHPALRHTLERIDRRLAKSY